MKNTFTLLQNAILKCALMVAMFCMAETTYASHAMGGELTYRWLSGNTYEIKLALYRDCSGIQAPSTVTVTAVAVSAAANQTIMLTEDSSHLTTTLEICPAQDTSTVCFGGALMGYEKHVYIGTVTLPALAADWKFEFNECCRNGAITNLETPANHDMTLTATLDNSAGNNSSPVFLSPPVIIIHNLSTQQLNWTATDPDGDVLHYTLTTPQAASTGPIQYATGFSATQPFTSFSPMVIDTLSGVITVSPSALQVAVLSMDIVEYRQGNIVGTLRRDMQVLVVNGGADSIPVLSGFNGSAAYETGVSIGDTANWNIFSFDGDSAEQLTVTYDSALINMGATVTVTGGLTPGVSIQWPATGVTVGSALFFTLTVRDEHCPFSSVQTYTYKVHVVPQCSGICVWPGDANYDGVVDNNDLLGVGLGYSGSGPVRTSQDIFWYAHAATDWADTLPGGTNYKHIDANGNGTLGVDDASAIIQNYSLTHPRSGGAAEPRGGVPVLHVQLSTDTVSNGGTLTAALLLGDGQNTATDVYGLAFTFNFDPTLIESNGVSIAFNNNSWLCNSTTDHLDIAKTFFNEGQIQAALVRNDHTPRNGNGQIATVTMNIRPGNGSAAYYQLLTYISNLVVIDNEGNYLTVDMGADTATIRYTVTGIAEISLTSDVSVYPNPATDVLNITSKQHSIHQVTITNLLGEVVLSSKPENGNNASVNTSQLAQGVYIIRVLSGSNKFVGRFVKN